MTDPDLTGFYAFSPPANRANFLHILGRNCRFLSPCRGRTRPDYFNLNIRNVFPEVMFKTPLTIHCKISCIGCTCRGSCFCERACFCLLSAFYNTPPLLRTLLRTPVSTEILTRCLLRTLLRSTSFKEPSKNPSKKACCCMTPLVCALLKVALPKVIFTFGGSF